MIGDVLAATVGGRVDKLRSGGVRVFCMIFETFSRAVSKTASGFSSGTVSGTVSAVSGLISGTISGLVTGKSPGQVIVRSLMRS